MPIHHGIADIIELLSRVSRTPKLQTLDSCQGNLGEAYVIDGAPQWKRPAWEDQFQGRLLRWDSLYPKGFRYRLTSISSGVLVTLDV